MRSGAANPAFPVTALKQNAPDLYAFKPKCAGERAQHWSYLGGHPFSRMEAGSLKGLGLNGPSACKSVGRLSLNGPSQARGSRQFDWKQQKLR